MSLFARIALVLLITQATPDTSLDKRLAAAVTSGSAFEVRELLEAGADPNYVHHTAHSGPIPTIALAAMADSSTPGKAERARKVVRLLVEYGACVNPKLGDCFPIAFPIRAGHTHGVDVLLDAGASVNAPGPQGITPLMVAASKCNPQMVQHLLSKGANSCARDADGRIAREHAAECGDAEALLRLLPECGG